MSSSTEMFLPTDLVLPLSAAQMGVWTAQSLDPQNPRFNCGGFLDIPGGVDRGALSAAVRAVVAETEALRVRFDVVDGAPVQLVRDEVDAAVDHVDLSAQPDAFAQAESLMQEDLARPVDIVGDRLFRHLIVHLAPDRDLFYVRFHHIVLDGFSQSVYWHRIAAVYNAITARRPAAPTSFLPLRQLLDSEAAYRDSAARADDRAYWQRRLAGFALPGGEAPSAMGSGGVLRRRLSLDGPGLGAAATRLRTRWSVLAIAAVAACLHRLGGDEDVLLRVPVTGRLGGALRDTPGMLANELPLCLRVTAATTVAELLGQVTRRVGELLAHQRYRGEDLLRDVRHSGAAEHLGGPVVNVVGFDREVRLGDRPATAHYLSTGPVRDLSIDVYGASDGSGLQLYVSGNPQRRSPQEVSDVQRRLARALDWLAAADPATPIAELDLLDPDERRRVLETFNDTAQEWDLSRGLHELIAEQAARTPDAPAVATTEAALTYRELEERAGQVAAALIRRGVGPGDLVGVYDERSADLVVSLLGVLKAGAAYLPLDPEAPRSRTEFQLADAGVRVVLSRSRWATALAGVAADVLPADDPAERRDTAHRPASGDDVAYVIYTSGSTGKPKGVLVPHRGVVNRLLWMQRYAPIGAADTVLQKTPFTFDVSVWEFFWPLLTGARLFLAAPGEHRDPRALARTMREQHVSTVHFVPPMLDLFLAEPAAAGLPALRQVFCSGEALAPEVVEAFFARYDPDATGVRLHNLYGPTEASIDVTAWPCHPRDARAAVPIGRPVANTSVYLLDPGGRPVVPGRPGELYIGGVQVALGYLNRPELTAERFVPSPWAPPQSPGMLYRTGDLARHRPDGAIEFLGRLDHQVKIRGFRVEPGEIESVLREHPAVAQAVVVPWQPAVGERRLVAYVSPNPAAPEHPADPAELTAFAAARLPDYLVPAHVIVLPALPLNHNGKVDRAALPAPTAEQAPAAVTAPPGTDAERALAAAWHAVLPGVTFGIDDSFVALGGDSMLSIRVRAALEPAGWTTDVADMLAYPTIRQLAARLRPIGPTGPAGRRAARPGPFALLRPEDRRRLPADLEDAYPLSAMQAGMLLHAELDEHGGVYRVVTSVHVAAPLDLAALRRAVAATVARHPALRSSFDTATYSEPLQLIHRRVDVPVTVGADLAHLAPADQADAIEAWAQQAKRHRFDVTRAPLLAFTVHPAGAGFHLAVVEHHVVLDGWSDTAMIDEIVARYQAAGNGEELLLPAITATFRDFVAEERREAADAGHRDYWRRVLAAAEDTPLPAPEPGAPVPAGRHRRLPVEVAPAVAARLHAVALAAGVPIKALLTAVHVAVLRHICGCDAVLTGVVANGRLEEAGADEVIGVFLNTLPLPVSAGRDDWTTVARRIAEHERDSAPHRRYPFAQMQRDRGGDLRVGSYVNYMDFHRRWQEPDALVTGGLGIADTDVPLAVNILVHPIEQRLTMWLDCDLTAVSADVAQRLPGYYRRALAAAGEPGRALADAELTGEQERTRLAAWNATQLPYERDVTVHELIARQARRSPDAVAVSDTREALRYAELDRRAERLAAVLRAAGAGPGELVGVAVPRRASLVVALLAVLRTGAAYVPLDTSFPEQRLAFITRDAAIRCVLVDGAVPAGVTAGRVLDLSTLDLGRPADPAEPDAVGPDAAAAPAYVIYTSGSTGQPKGTIVTHRNVVNFFAGMAERIGCAPDDTTLALTSVSFDISVLELLWPLTTGAHVVVAPAGIVANLGAAMAPAPVRLSAAVTAAVPEPDRAALPAAGFAEVWTVGPDGGRAADTTAATLEDFEQAGRHGRRVLAPAGVFGAGPLAAGVKLYRSAWEQAGHPGAGWVCAVLALPGAETPALRPLHELGEAGVDEIACLVDSAPAAAGARAVVGRYDRELAAFGESFTALCRRHAVTLLQCTPSFMAALAAEPAALAALRGARAVLVGGEAFPAGLAARLFAELPGTEVWNMYGPTETTIWSTVYRLDPVRDAAGHGIPLGRPIANTTLAVLGAHDRPTPIGVSGELLIGGDGVTRGYLNREALTAERFVERPDLGGRFYRTGDRVRWRADGVLEFLGRLDRQVKILGHRIEPDEVESVLSQHPQVAAVAVIAAPKPGGAAELVAFVAPREGLAGGAAEHTHVGRWAEVWQDAYASSPERGGAAGPDFSGWRSSYTGEPIPARLMRQWLDATVERIVALRPRRVVDVGVGVGLFLQRLAGVVEHYTGLDVAERAVEAAAARAAADPDLAGRVTVRQGDAQRLADLEPGGADLVLLNSVVQYFPSLDYLRRVLDAARAAAGPAGAVFVGDVRHHGLLAAFHATVQLHRAPPLTAAATLAATVERQVAEERELCLAPSFFDGPGPVERQLKFGGGPDELTLFRYDVTLPGPERPRPQPPAATIAWSPGPQPLDRLTELLTGAGGRPILVTGLTDARLVGPLALPGLLAAAGPQDTAWDVERRLWEVHDDTAVDPADVAALAARTGWTARLSPSVHTPGQFDARFDPGPDGRTDARSDRTETAR